MTKYYQQGMLIIIQEDDIARFWTKVDKECKNGCWEWINCKGRYGRFWVDGSTFNAHRISWLINRGQIPYEMEVLHTCDNKICVNPDHLYLGTQAENNRDRITRFNGKVAGRPKKFSIQEIDVIKDLYRSGMLQLNIAEQFNTTASTISLAVNDKLYINGSSYRAEENYREKRKNII